MNHNEAISLLSDLLAGGIPEPAAAEARAHVASCRECQDVIAMMDEVRVAIAAGGPALFSPHPTSEDIVRFALMDPELSTTALARLGNHVRGCPECEHAATLTREADAATRELQSKRRPTSQNNVWLRWLRSAPALVPAFAALVVVLAYPAYRGAVEYPALRRTHDSSTRELEGLRREQATLRDEIGSRRAAEERSRSSAGPAHLLYLPATTRGEGSHARVELLPGQRFQPIIIQNRPFSGDTPSGTVEIRLLRQNDGVETWRDERRVAELWDAAYSSLFLLVPVDVLPPGEYRLEILQRGTVGYSADFAVTAELPASR